MQLLAVNADRHIHSGSDPQFSAREDRDCEALQAFELDREKTKTSHGQQLPADAQGR